MTNETLARVEFLVDMGHKESPAHIATEYIHSGRCLDIPEVPSDMADHVGDHVTMIRVTVFKEVE
jgi:hypothetical protein